MSVEYFLGDRWMPLTTRDVTPELVSMCSLFGLMIRMPDDDPPCARYMIEISNGEDPDTASISMSVMMCGSSCPNPQCKADKESNIRYVVEIMKAMSNVASSYCEIYVEEQEVDNVIQYE